MKQSRNENLMKTFGTCHFIPLHLTLPFSIRLSCSLCSVRAHSHDSTRACIHLKYKQQA